MKKIFWFIFVFILNYLVLAPRFEIYADSCPGGNVWSITDFGANGNDTLDDYAALLKASQCASNKENITLYFPAGHYYIKEYRITGVTADGRQPNNIAGIVFNNSTNLKIIGAGKDKTVIDVKGDYHMTADKLGYDGIEGHDLSYSMDVIPFFFNNCNGFHLGGFELDGNFDQTIVAPSIFQPHTSMGVFIHGSSNFTLANLNVHHFAEDGVYLGGGNIDKDGLIYNVDSHHNGRQGMSITNARGVTVVNSSFTWTGFGNSKFFLPGCGIDVEPDREYQNPSDSTNDVVFINIHLAHNRGNPEDFICVYNPAARLHDLTLHLYNPTTIFREIDYFVSNIVDHNNDTDTSALVSVVTSLTMNELQNSWLVSGDVTINLKTGGINTIKYFLDSSPVTEVVPASQKIIIHTNNYINGRHYLSAVATNNSNQTVNFNPIALIFINLPEATPIITPPPPPTPINCSSSTISSSTISSSNSLTVTMTANKPIKNFSLAFYNPDNLYGPGNPKPLYFEAGKQFSISKEATSLTQTISFIINYADINKPDLNNNSQKPTNIQVNGYFIDPDTGQTSLPEARCVVQFNIERPGDLNHDGYVNILDYNLLVTNFGNPYTIFDYNVLVGNWGKTQ